MFTNELPIVTHWHSGGNDGKGYFSIGSSDPIILSDLDTATGNEIRIDSLHSQSDTFYYNSKKFALFTSSSSSANNNTLIPAYERYIGERYSTTKISDLIAMKRANEILKTTHYPARFWNYSQSIYFVSNFIDSIPIFQVVNCIVVTRPSDINGDSSSLCTVVLPPFWNHIHDLSGNPKYPILFNSFYDLNSNVFSESQLSNICQPMAKMIDLNQQSAIGFFWNGGGAEGCASQQNSIFSEADYIFQLIGLNLNADPFKIIAYGISRSAHFPLYLATRSTDSYKILCVFANSPAALDFEKMVYTDDCLTYPALAYVNSYATGHQMAWKSSWVNPDTNGNGLLNGKDLTIKNALGDTGLAFAKARSILQNDTLLNSLAARGTRLFLRIGTFDAFCSYATADKWFNRLLNNPLFYNKIQVKIFHRGGHGQFTGDELEKALLSLATNTDLFQYEYNVKHYQRNASGYFDTIALPLNRTRPFLLEAPALAVRGRKIQVNIVGEPHYQFRLEVYLGHKGPIAHLVSNNGKDTLIAKDTIFNDRQVFSMIDTIPDSGSVSIHTIFSTDSLLWPTTVFHTLDGNNNSVPDSAGSLCNVYRFYYKQKSDTNWIPVTKVSGEINKQFKAGGENAVLYIYGANCEPNYTGLELWNTLAPTTTNGLSEY